MVSRVSFFNGYTYSKEIFSKTQRNWVDSAQDRGYCSCVAKQGMSEVISGVLISERAALMMINSAVPDHRITLF